MYIISILTESIHYEVLILHKITHLLYNRLLYIIGRNVLIVHRNSETNF